MSPPSSSRMTCSRFTPDYEGVESSHRNDSSDRRQETHRHSHGHGATACGQRCTANAVILAVRTAPNLTVSEHRRPVTLAEKGKNIMIARIATIATAIAIGFGLSACGGTDTLDFNDSEALYDFSHHLHEVCEEAPEYGACFEDTLAGVTVTMTGPVVALSKVADDRIVDVASRHPNAFGWQKITDTAAQDRTSSGYFVTFVCPTSVDGCDKVEVYDNVDIRAEFRFRDIPGRQDRKFEKVVTEITIEQSPSAA